MPREPKFIFKGFGKKHPFHKDVIQEHQKNGLEPDYILNQARTSGHQIEETQNKGRKEITIINKDTAGRFLEQRKQSEAEQRIAKNVFSYVDSTGNVTKKGRAFIAFIEKNADKLEIIKIDIVIPKIKFKINGKIFEYFGQFTVSQREHGAHAQILENQNQFSAIPVSFFKLNNTILGKAIREAEIKKQEWMNSHKK
ncbi:MAG: hypothetical protein JW703_02260 [Candidatus Diapherotrites archaeon]|nr:hypothetical protein [Candidatus Diapherotrites archaeon]